MGVAAATGGALRAAGFPLSVRLLTGPGRGDTAVGGSEWVPGVLQDASCHRSASLGAMC